MNEFLTACLLILAFDIPISRDLSHQSLDLRVTVEWCQEPWQIAQHQGTVRVIRQARDVDGKALGAPAVELKTVDVQVPTPPHD